MAPSDKIDVSTARLVARELSDGVVATDFDGEALEILSKKRGGKFCVLQMDLWYTGKVHLGKRAQASPISPCYPAFQRPGPADPSVREVLHWPRSQAR